VVRREGGKLRYIDVWVSKEACDRAFAQRIHPAVQQTFRELGFQPDGEPTRREIDLVDVVTR
jgi:hypothetical protein